jgi:hypothetical protein
MKEALEKLHGAMKELNNAIQAVSAVRVRNFCCVFDECIKCPLSDTECSDVIALSKFLARKEEGLQGAGL